MAVPSLLVQFYRSSGFDSVAGKPNYVSEDEARFAIEGGLSLFNRLCNQEHTLLDNGTLTTGDILVDRIVVELACYLKELEYDRRHYDPDGEVVDNSHYITALELMKQLYGTRNKNGEIVLPLHSDDSVALATIENREFGGLTMRHIEIRDTIANALRAESYAGCMFEGFEVHSSPPHDGNIRLPAFVFIMDVPTVAFDMLGGERMMVFTLTIDMAFHYGDEGEMVNGQYYTGADLVNLYASRFTKLMRDVDLSNIPILDNEIMVTPRYPEEMDDDRYGFVAELRFTYKEAS